MARRRHEILLEIRVIDDFEPPFGFWELNPGPAEEQPAL